MALARVVTFEGVSKQRMDSLRDRRYQDWPSDTSREGARILEGRDGGRAGLGLPRRRSLPTHRRLVQAGPDRGSHDQLSRRRFDEGCKRISLLNHVSDRYDRMKAADALSDWNALHQDSVARHVG
jgi:hypothetical protein